MSRRCHHQLQQRTTAGHRRRLGRDHARHRHHQPAHRRDRLRLSRPGHRRAERRPVQPRHRVGHDHGRRCQRRHPGKDFLDITRGSLNVTAGGDGIKSDDTEADRGRLTITNGTVRVVAGDDARGESSANLDPGHAHDRHPDAESTIQCSQAMADVSAARREAL
ncbi:MULTISPECIES: carbohydrate-binding domain-containing protein [unclassified Micromonospora]|uniref:carbohydrate-binding domain-containing protein n=1 Tax=unclassified Micromonospora TaxID=2617518 RepID=UPI003A874971